MLTQSEPRPSLSGESGRLASTAMHVEALHGLSATSGDTAQSSDGRTHGKLAPRTEEKTTAANPCALSERGHRIPRSVQSQVEIQSVPTVESEAIRSSATYPHRLAAPVIR